MQFCKLIMLCYLLLLTPINSFAKATNKSKPIATKTITQKKPSSPTGQLGIASYYGGKFHGRRTANGEIYNKNAYTAAHLTLPFNTYLLVTNQRNGRKVIVRINDRGPYIKGRIIDLSQKSAQSIGMLNSGITEVKIEKIILERNSSSQIKIQKIPY